MKKNFYTICCLVVLTCFFLCIFLYSEDVMDSITFSISIWKDNLLPSLFPFFLASSFLLEYGFIDWISNFFGPIVSSLFHLPKEASFVIFASLFSGFPSGSKYTKDLLERGLITMEEANHLILFTHFSNPLFVTSTIGVLLLNQKKVGYFLLAVHILTALLLGILFRRKEKKISIRKPLKEVLKTLQEKEKQRESFIKILSSSILETFLVLVNMLGIIMFFLILTTILGKIIPLENNFGAFLRGILEMTQGVKYLAGSNLSLKWKTTLIGFLISFSGFSVHFQVRNIIEGTSIRYRKFLLVRLLHGIFCATVIYLLFDFVI